MAEMTCRERIVAAFEHRESDRVPAYDLLRNEGAIRHYAGEAVTYDNWQAVIPKACARCLDMTRSLRGPAREQRIEGADGSVQVIQRWTTWHPVKPIRTTEDLVATFRRHAEAPPPTRYQLNAQADQRIAWHVDWQAKLGETLQIWQIGGVGLHQAHGLAGLELFSYALADAPETVGAFLATLADRHVERVHAIFSRLDADLKERLAPVTFVGDDIAYNKGSMFRREWLQKRFFPHLKRICDAYHEHGIWVMYHSDGDLNALLDDFLAAGIDGLNPIERQANMDLADLKARYGHRWTLCGGVDINNLVRHGSVDDVIAGTKQAILEAGRDGGYLCGSTTELEDDLPADNVIAMLETIRHHGDYRRLAAEERR